MSKQPHPKPSVTKKSFSLVVLPIIFVCLSMVTYNESLELTNLTSLNEFIEKIAHSDIDMCNNTYEYICSNFPSSSQTDKERNLRELKAILLRQIRYKEHPFLELAQETFIKCNKETAKDDDKEKENWHVVSEIVNDLGGWPIVQNASRVSWNSSSYNWIDTISKLRKIGIPSILLKLSVIPNPKKKTEEKDGDKKHPLLKLDMVTNDYYIRFIILEDRMVHLVRMFQLFQPHNVVIDEPKVREAYNRILKFVAKLNKFTEDLPKDSPSYIYTVEEIANETVPIDWLKLLNGLSGRPKNVVLNEEVQVAFPEAPKLKKFIQFIEDTPKEVVANYIIWTVLYELLPYMRENVRHEMGMEEVPENFCFTEVEKRFELSPLSILADQEYFPPSFRADINEFISKVKNAAISFVKDRTVIRNENETQMIVNETQKLQVQIARPEEYYNMSVLDAGLDPEWVFDVNEVLKDETKGVNYYMTLLDLGLYYREERRFLTHILLLNRINDIAMFNKVLQQKPAAFDLEYLKSYSITYLRERNIIFVPRVVFQRLYSKELYGFVNWARLGTTLLSYFFNKFAEHREYLRENNYTEIMEKLLIETYSSYLQIAPQEIASKYSQKKELLGKQSAKQVLAGEAALFYYKNTSLGQSLLSHRQSLSANYTPDDVTWRLIASTFCFRNESHEDAYETKMVFDVLFENTFYNRRLLENCSSNSKIRRFDKRIKDYNSKRVMRFY